MLPAAAPSALARCHMNMDITNLTIITAALLAVAGYAHYRIAAHTGSSGKRALAHAVLIAAGIGFGYMSADRVETADGMATLLGFLSGFGMVHVPAAMILLYRQRRGKGKS